MCKLQFYSWQKKENEMKKQTLVNRIMSTNNDEFYMDYIKDMETGAIVKLSEKTFKDNLMALSIDDLEQFLEVETKK